jgi:selenocysteine lyase/cysteine desulfurase
LHPTLTGWWGVEDSFDWEAPPPHAARSDAEQFQDGSPPLFGAFALRAALEVIETEGITAIQGTVMDNIAAIEEVIKAAGGEILEPWDGEDERSGIISFCLEGEASAHTTQRLEDAEIIVSERSGWVRVAPHASTDPAVGDVLAEVLDLSR